MAKVRPCDRAVAQARPHKAVEFWEAAEVIREFADDEADVGDDHQEAVKLLGSVRPEGDGRGNALSALLAIKTKAGYSHRSVNANDRGRAQRQAEKLVTAARERLSGGR
jgi:hypothetical protein